MPQNQPPARPKPQELWTLSTMEDIESRFGMLCIDCQATWPSYAVTHGGSGGVGVCGSCADKRIERWLVRQTQRGPSETELSFAAFHSDWSYDVVVAEQVGEEERLTFHRFPRRAR